MVLGGVGLQFVSRQIRLQPAVQQVQQVVRGIDRALALQLIGVEALFVGIRFQVVEDVCRLPAQHPFDIVSKAGVEAGGHYHPAGFQGPRHQLEDVQAARVRRLPSLEELPLRRLVVGVFILRQKFAT